MQTKEITYFSLSVDRAEKRYADYKARTETQARNLGFVCAGNLRKGSRNRLNTITDKSAPDGLRSQRGCCRSLRWLRMRRQRPWILRSGLRGGIRRTFRR